jgi:hypothetical protein
MKITIKYGMTTTVERENITEGSCVDDVITSELIALIGAPENAAVMRDGDELEGCSELFDGDTLILERHASRKA